MLAIGTETNGSIVCPSSLNGIVGIKPTVGLISRSGIIPISFTQDTPGPMARTVTDAAICLGTMIGVDSKDSKTSISEGKALGDYTPFLKKDGMEGKRIGFYSSPMGTNFKVDDLMNKNIELLTEMGAEIVEIDEITPSETGSLSFQVMLYEYKDGLNHYFASLGDESLIKSLDDLITFNRNASEEMEFYNQKYLEMANEMESLDSEGYIETLEALRRSSQDEGIDRVMALHNLDAIVSPTGTPAWKTDHVIGDHYQLSSSSPAAQSGYPNVTVPMGYISGLPVGISFFGRAWSEPLLIEIAYAYEQASQHRQAPEFLSEAF
jgi:amidase